MKTALVGYTGFVGSNILSAGSFDRVYNSKNIEDAYGTAPELLIYAGLRAEKYLANHAPEQDMALIRQAEQNIAKIRPKKLVLISTIDVFPVPRAVDERSAIDTAGQNAYGYNRHQLELWVRENQPDSLIIRLPGLFGRNIKKNFIYDYIHVIPFMLKASKFRELASADPVLKAYYRLQSNGFYQAEVPEQDRSLLKAHFRQLGFSALNFTDSRSVYQFYRLDRLWSDIQLALKNDLTLLHPATEPVSAGELYQYLTGKRFDNLLDGTPAHYDYRTIHAALFAGSNGYIENKAAVLNAIRTFIMGEKSDA